MLVAVLFLRFSSPRDGSLRRCDVVRRLRAVAELLLRLFRRWSWFRCRHFAGVVVVVAHHDSQRLRHLHLQSLRHHDFVRHLRLLLLRDDSSGRCFH